VKNKGSKHRNRVEGRGWGSRGRELGTLVPPPGASAARNPRKTGSFSTHPVQAQSGVELTSRFSPTRKSEEPVVCQEWNPSIARESQLMAITGLVKSLDGLFDGRTWLLSLARQSLSGKHQRSSVLPPSTHPATALVEYDQCHPPPHWSSTTSATHHRQPPHHLPPHSSTTSATHHPLWSSTTSATIK